MFFLSSSFALSLTAALWAQVAAGHPGLDKGPAQVALTPSSGPAPANETKVPVILGVMSRCPDALFCESVFEDVLKRVGQKVELELTFIGKPNASEPNFGVTCLHGPLECAGNVQELCAAAHLEQSVWWPYVLCQNFQGRDKVGLPETGISCAKASGFEWEGSDVAKCVGEDGSATAAEGVGLLKQSVLTSQSLGIEKSCTIIINGEPRCVHDGEWKQCPDGHTVADFVREINEEYEKLNG